MKPARQLIINADDFGLSAGINRAIFRAHEHGVLTSASLMVRGAAAEAAADYARNHPGLSVGLHVDLGEAEYSVDGWRSVYEVVDVTDAAAVDTEVMRQLEEFHRLVGRAPTHLDSHQHVHHAEPILSILRREARKLDVVLRGDHPVVRYCGEFYGQSNKGYPCHEFISVEAACSIVGALPPGITELGCHPGEAESLNSVYRVEREIEARTLCDPRVRDSIRDAGVFLRSFVDAEL